MRDEHEATTSSDDEGDGDDDALRAALARAPRRFPAPALPADLDAAQAAGPAAVLAFCLEQAHRALATPSTTPVVVPDRWAGPFAQALSRLIAHAARADAGDGDAAWRSRVIAAGSDEVQRFLQDEAALARASGALQPLVDAIAHPGKLRGRPPGTLRDGLARLHDRARTNDLAGVARTARELLAGEAARDDTLRSRLETLLAHPALTDPSPAGPPGHAPVPPEVARYLQLAARSRHAGEHAASAAARGSATESATRAAFEQLARRLDARAPAGDGVRATHRVVRQLRLPAGFPGGAHRAKSEWDVALLRRRPGGDGEAVVLLGEAKASPEAAVNDLPRLLRGLARIAHAPPGAPVAWPSADGDVCLHAASWQALAPHDGEIPWRVVYCCDATADATPPLLAAPALGRLLAEPACLRFAWDLMQGRQPSPDELVPTWRDVLHQPRLRPVLHQHDTARRVRQAMLHPDDLVAAVQALA